MSVTPEEAGQQFAAIGRVTSVGVLGGGHIHQTWSVFGPEGHFVVQRCNTRVFKDLDAVMANIAVVCAAVYPDLQPLPTRDGQLLWRPAPDEAWRAFGFLEETVNARDLPEPFAPNRLHELGRGLGELHSRLATIDPGLLVESMPGFHDPMLRLERLDLVRGNDAAGRVSDAVAELDVVDELRHLAEAAVHLTPPEVPRRVAHFDAKLDNFLLDSKTARVRAVIDLDTVMPGSLLWDVGDLARSATASAPEDEPRRERMRFLPDRFRALIDGYLSETVNLLTPEERRGIATAPVVVTFEQAVRFLTDFLEGDVYYRIERPRHNLDRARAQLALVGSMWAQRSAMILAS